MYTVHVAPVATEAQELGRARPSQRRAVKSADPDDVRACGSARIGALMQRPPPARSGLHGRGWRRQGRRVPCPCEGGLHMGERRSDGMGASFRWDSANLPALSRLVDALPCAQTPLCAHGSRRPTSTCVRESRNHAENRHSSWWALLSHVQPFCAAPQSDLRAAAAPSRTQRQTTTRPRKRSNAQFLGEMPGQPPDTSTRPPKSRGSLTMRGTAGSRLSRTATALATLLHPPFPIGDPPIPRRA